jgi:predicted small lipoprotein YifL
MARKDRFRRLGWSALLLLTALALLPAGCGKKGDPELPEGQTDEFPRQYPDPDSL